MTTVSSTLRQNQLENERHFIACIFADSSGFRTEQMAWLPAEFFIDTILGDYWRAVRAGGNPVEVANNKSLIAEFSKYVLEVPSMVDVEVYASAIVQGNYLRNIYSRMSTLASSLAARDVAAIRSVLYEMSELSLLDNKTSDIGEVHERFRRLLNKIKDGNSPVIVTFLPQIDAMIGGFYDEMIVFAARPGVGKTQLSWQIACNAAEHGKKRVLFFSLEMDEMQLWARFACPLAGYVWKDVRSKSVSDAAYAEVERASAKLRDRLSPNLSIIGDAYSVHEIHQRCIAEHPDFVVIDQLPEIVWHDPRAKKVDWYGQAVKYLRDHICKRLGSPTLLVHQLNRASMERQDKHPQLQDLRDSGELEQRADIVLLAHREDMFDTTISVQNKITNVPFEIWTPKNRFGVASAVAILDYDLTKQWFS